MENIALWMSQPHHGYLEIARTLGVKSLVLELEHGTFDLSTLDQFLAYTKALGMPVLTKILAPNAESIQQALDFGSDGVIVPHLLGVEHARAVTRAAKYPCWACAPTPAAGCSAMRGRPAMRSTGKTPAASATP